ncbi:hypothetical protein P7C71_g875, partial [Lecanoromycetidae sp. Uapishka_2]
MNSLNILSARVIGPTPPPSPTSSRSRSYSDGNLKKDLSTEKKPKRSASQHVKGGPVDVVEEKKAGGRNDNVERDRSIGAEPNNDVSEETPLLAATIETESLPKPSPGYNKLRQATKRLVAALTESLRWVLSTIASPGVYLIAGFYDENGRFSPLLPMRKLCRVLPRKMGRKSTAQAVGLSGSSDASENAITSSMEKSGRRRAQQKEHKRKPVTGDSFSAATSESEPEIGEKTVILDAPMEGRPRVQSSSSSEDVPQTRRSIRIKLYNEDTVRRRKQKKEKADSGHGAGTNSDDQHPTLTVANIKSPTSPASSLRMTKYPRAPAPPRPLIPRRQPSYSAQPPRSSRLVQKTLVIDLDETLIHSLAKGGRMSSGHMVEVKLNTAVGYGGATLGPQHPILYYVHKHNAIPIEGWINDPTDNDLLHLVPILEGLQYVTDVRALLALRRGEVDASH